jgi:hypothetical protein
MSWKPLTTKIGIPTIASEVDVDVETPHVGCELRSCSSGWGFGGRFMLIALVIWLQMQPRPSFYPRTRFVRVGSARKGIKKR